MKTPRWIMPTVSILAAIAMAVSGGLIGSTFAAHTTNQVSSGTEIVPVIAPISIGQPPTDADFAQAGANGASQVVAEREVRLPATDPTAIDPALLDLMTTLNESLDPETEIFILGRYGHDSDDGASGGDDPCAPRDGSYPDDCPDGYHSTVLPLIAMPDFIQTARAFPQTGEEYRERRRGLVWCDGLTASDTSVPLGIASSVPGTFTVRYWPSAHPDRVHEVTGIETSSEDRQVFDDALHAAEDPFDVPLVQHCLTLDGLQPATVYTAVVTGTDINDRSSRPSTVRFNSAGAPTHPGAHIIPAGENLVYVSALHPEDQEVEIRAVARTPDAVPTCSEIDSTMSLRALTEDYTAADEEDLIYENAPVSFDQKYAVMFAVPEGSTVVVCARWYEDDTSPSWERVQPLFESSAVVQAPDRLDPRVELTQVTRPSPNLESTYVSISTPQGDFCGGAQWDAVDGDARLPLLLCKTTGNTGGVHTNSDGQFRDSGTSNDLVVLTTSRFHNGSTAPAYALIPGADGGCRGMCTLPPDAFYTIDLVTPSFDFAGRAVVRVSWEQGDQNGQSDWNVTPTSDVAPEYDVPDEAQFDKSERWVVDEPQWAGNQGVFRPVTSVSGRFRLTVDRPVDYTVRMLQNASFDQAESCSHPGEPIMKSGHINDRDEIVLHGLCLGALYFPEIELVDADGRTTIWNMQDRVHFWGAQTMVTVPGILSTVSIRLEGGTGSKGNLRSRDVRVGADYYLPMDVFGGICLGSGNVGAQLTRDTELPATVVIAVSARVQHYGSGSDTDCKNFNGEVSSGYARTVVPIADLFGEGGVTLESRDPTLVLKLTVQAKHPRD